MVDDNQRLNIPEEDDRHLIDILERDACALICAVRKGGQATHGNVKRTIEGLARMGHRTGYLDGEGDGVGILTDIPRQLWAKKLTSLGLRSSLALDRHFWVAHLMIPAAERNRAQILVDEICSQITDKGLQLLYEQPGTVDSSVLGPGAEKNQPVFWQIAGMNGQVASHLLDQTIFELQMQLEKDLKVHFASFSAHSVVYKVQGTVEILRRYYPELRDTDYASTVTLGHARYSTNTNPIFERAQPFGLLGHNGEFNTISRFKLEAAMLGIPLDPNNSDSQDVDRAVQAFCMRFGLDLIEAMEYIFPPFGHDLVENSPDIHAMYDEIRRSFGPFAQGPAAVVARLGDLCVFSVDALGLRPLWLGETEKEFFATSERGVYPLDAMSVDPKPIAPGEKVALRIRPGHSVEMLTYPEIQRYVYNRHRDRTPYRMEVNSGSAGSLWKLSTETEGYPSVSGNGHGNGNGGSNGGSSKPTQVALQTSAEPVAVALAQMPNPQGYPWLKRQTTLNTNTMAALGWERYHTTVIEAITEGSKELIGSLGWDGPIAALSKNRINVADYFKETVAVVTNPAIDKEREVAQFSTRVVLGLRPDIGLLPQDQQTIVVGSRQPMSTQDIEDCTTIQLDTPLLIGGHADLGNIEALRQAADKRGTMVAEDLLARFGDKAVILTLGAALDENIETAVERIAQAAVRAVTNGARCIVLDDTEVFGGQTLWIDPMIVTAAVDKALRQADIDGVNLRRQAGIVVRSGSLRDLHDLVMCISVGANALVPYALYAVALGIAPRAPKIPPTSEEIVNIFAKLIDILNGAIEKVTSTIGCHELRGYGHSLSSIGLAKSVASVFGMPNYYGSEGRGLTWGELKAWGEERASEMRGEIAGKMANPDRFYPKMWKKAEDVALGEMGLEEYSNALLELEERQPVSIRHILGFKTAPGKVKPKDVDLHIKDHRMPVFIGAMSFGSQGELAYKAYAEAAYQLDIFCVNGEGGELQDIMGKYPKHRGQQIASARFGVNIEYLNSVNLIEIKIGQGAKPGEGGHLPGFKVTEQVAAARKTVPGVALISPSNNHDLYSIEDLAQMIDELKTANPRARVSVKVPVVPGVGIIAVGIAKAGADVVNIAGYEGGTGAARAHSLRHVGLPAEIGVWLAHRALIESGLRDKVEIWTDGGMK
ncbi:MAG: glutamate synthase, partial [Anaerolineae bacterium]|nr:glutamate synthase [Anaerolineae bacterium]